MLQVPAVGIDSTVQELAYIEVVAYTEAFFKDHFAAILNIFPEKTKILRDHGQDISVDLSDLLELEEPVHTKFGFLLSERLNFGSPKSVNSLFTKLLSLTPFSTHRVVEFDRVIANRNLLIHHGGILTTQFGRSMTEQLRERRFLDSLEITKEQIGEAAQLALEVAKGTVRATVVKLLDELRNQPQGDSRRKAVKYMEGALESEKTLSAKLAMLIRGESPYGSSAGITDDDVPF